MKTIDRLQYEEQYKPCPKREYKVCSQCGKSKRIDNFSPKGRKPDGQIQRQSACKQCEAQRHRDSRKVWLDRKIWSDEGIFARILDKARTE